MSESRIGRGKPVARDDGYHHRRSEKSDAPAYAPRRSIVRGAGDGDDHGHVPRWGEILRRTRPHTFGGDALTISTVRYITADRDLVHAKRSEQQTDGLCYRLCKHTQWEAFAVCFLFLQPFSCSFLNSSLSRHKEDFRNIFCAQGWIFFRFLRE